MVQCLVEELGEEWAQRISLADPILAIHALADKQADWPAVNEFCQEVQAVGEAAFGEQLRDADGYRQRCRNRWGAGPGYKTDIRRWTDARFSQECRGERRRFIELEVQRRWHDLVQRIQSHVAPAAPDEAAARDFELR